MFFFRVILDFEENNNFCRIVFWINDKIMLIIMNIKRKICEKFISLKR